jgi:hypothetical protein
MSNVNVNWACRQCSQMGEQWASNEDLFKVRVDTQYRILVRELICHAGHDLSH